MAKKFKIGSKNIETDFITLTSHQLRTPLSGMKWLLELLQKDNNKNLTRKQRQFLEKIYNSNERMIALVNDLLEVSRIESGKEKLFVRPTDLASIVRALIREWEKEIKRKKLKVSLTVEQEPFPLVATEPNRIKQAIGNIISNSVIYNKDMGRIDIDLKVDGGKALVKVSHNGPPIPKEEQSRIFRKFFRGSNSIPLESHGTGLGLFIAKAFIEASGGKIWFESKPRTETAFYFTLPLMKTGPAEG